MSPLRLLLRVVVPLTPKKVVYGMPLVFALVALAWMPAYYWMTGGRTLIGLHHENFAYLVMVFVTVYVVLHGGAFVLMHAKDKYPAEFDQQFETYYEQRNT